VNPSSRVSRRHDLGPCGTYAVAMTSRIILTDTERAYVQRQPLGRLATVDANGAPQNNPVGVFLDEETGDIVIGGGDGRVPEVPQRSGQPPGRPGH
jgi:hypothetical protein